MELKTIKAALEAILFAYAEPLPVARIAELLEIEPPLAEQLVLALRDECEAEERGVQLIQLEGAWQFATKQNHGEVVKKALDTRRNSPLSPAALEVLAIIAYNQPVSRSFIEQVRGVDSSSTVATLVEKGLVVEAGRLDLPGRPIAFKTTDAFLRSFGIAALSELPPLHTEAENTGPEAELFAHVQEAEAGHAGEEEELTHALRGGEFIEGERGAAALIGEEE